MSTDTKAATPPSVSKMRLWRETPEGYVPIVLQVNSMGVIVSEDLDTTRQVRKTMGAVDTDYLSSIGARFAVKDGRVEIEHMPKEAVEAGALLQKILSKTPEEVLSGSKMQDTTKGAVTGLLEEYLKARAAAQDEGCKGCELNSIYRSYHTKLTTLLHDAANKQVP